MDSKPIVLTDDDSLVDHDLSNVYAHWLIENPPIIDQQDIKFKKKEQIGTLKKSVLKHRIRLLTGKVSSDISCLVKLLLLCFISLQLLNFLCLNFELLN